MLAGMKSPSPFKQKLIKLAVLGFSIGVGAAVVLVFFSIWSYRQSLDKIADYREKKEIAESHKDWEPVMRDGNPVHLRTRYKDGLLSYRVTIASTSRPKKAIAIALKDRADFTLWSAAVEADQLSPEDPDSRLKGWFFEGEGRGVLSASQYSEASKLALWTVD
jgi:hypothetical protein